MNTACQPLPQFVAEEMLQIAAKAICDRPGETVHQRESRTRQMVCSILGFEPRDGLEYMLATMIVGHFHLILDSMRAALWGQMDQVKAQTKTGIVSLDRAMLGFVKEMRLVRHRPLARSAEDARRQTAATSPIETPEWVAAWAGVPEPAAPAPETATAPAAPETETKPAPSVPPSASHRTAGPAHPAHSPAAPAEAKPAASVTSRSGPMPPTGHDTTEHHKAVFEEALAGLVKRLEPRPSVVAG